MRAKFKVEDDRLASEKAKKDDPKALKGKGARTVAESAGEDSEGVQEPTSFPDDEGSNNSGFYELTGVLTHQGRSSSSGHYVAWVRHKKDVWLKFDDDEVSGVSAEDVLRLSGGGDWHCAYVLVYGPRQLVSHPPSPSTAAGAETKQETPANGKEEVQKMETS
ncbi:unnamed protein product [Cyprideis torosa]|nr:unnamed protein product [Cyprideis torosa]CAG0879676.1 unnamed protein product [Cyprideis torosa]